MMKSKQNVWGLAPFLLAIVCVSLSTFFGGPLLNTIPTVIYRRVIPWLGLMFSIMAFFAGHFSYPRVQNLKVHASGFLTGLIGLAYFVLHNPPGILLPFLPPPSESFVYFLYLLASLNMLILLFLPAYLKYRYTQYVSIVFAGGELVAILLVWTNVINMDFLLKLRGEPFSMQSMAFLIYFGAVGTASGLVFRMQFRLAGVFSGIVVLIASAWYISQFLLPAVFFHPWIFLFLPFLLNTGILLHWLARTEHHVSYDPLLHIYNRSYCMQILAEQSTVNTRPPFALAMVDIDHFKKVNDRYGHQLGDRVLYEVAQIIQKEAVPAGIVCRYGGEEIAVFFPKTEAREALPLLQRIRGKIANSPIQNRSMKIQVTVSIGLSVRTEAAQNLEDVLRAADRALYAAKENGRNQVRSAVLRPKQTGRAASKDGQKNTGKSNL